MFRKSVFAAVASLEIFISLITPALASADPPSCSAGKSQNIIAHQDDDLFFMNPTIRHDIDAGKCVETIVVTAGDAGNPDSTYWQGRENGLKVAYADMAGATNSWAQTGVTILGHTVQQFTLQAHPEVTLVFMRLPNGGEHTESVGGPVVEGWSSTGYSTLKKLWENSISTLTPIDSSPAYTRQELIDVLAVQMATYGASTLRTLDYTKPFDGADQTDHQAVAYFARLAHQQNIQQPHTFIGYEGYPVTSETTNVSGTDLSNKQNAYFAYDAYDSNTCTSVSVCAASEYPYRLDWLARNYTTGTESGGESSFQAQTLDGQAASASGYNANVGNQAASISFGSALHIFYYDQSSGDLRHVTKTSTGWTFQTVDGNSTGDGRISADVGQSPTVTEYYGSLHVFYYDATNGDIRHARTSDGSTWILETLDGSTGTMGNLNDNLGQTPKALVYGDTLQLFYYDATLGNLRHAYSNSTGWHFENLEGDIGSISNYNADIGTNVSAVVYGGTLQLFYYDTTEGNLRHAYSNSTGWHFENLDGNVGSILGFNTNTGAHPNAIVDASGVLQVFYYDITNGDLRHAWTSPTQSWLAENLMGDDHAIIRANSNVGITSEAVIHGGILNLFTYESSNGGGLVHLWQDSSGWHEEHVDGFGTTSKGSLNAQTGLEPSPISYGSQLNVFYYDIANGDLRYIVK